MKRIGRRSSHICTSSYCELLRILVSKRVITRMTFEGPRGTSKQFDAMTASSGILRAWNDMLRCIAITSKKSGTGSCIYTSINDTTIIANFKSKDLEQGRDLIHFDLVCGSSRAMLPA